MRMNFFQVCLFGLVVLLCAQLNNANHYEVLNVNFNANEDTIKKSYRELAKKYHPDKNRDDPGAQDKFIAIGAAYEVLSSHSKRREYDLSLQHPPGRRENRGHHTNSQSFHRGARPFHFQRAGGGGGSSFHFESTYEIPPVVSMILGMLLFALPLMMMCAPLFCIWLILWICGYRKASQRDDHDTEEVRKKLASHWQGDYLPVLTRRGVQTDRRIIVASLSRSAEVLAAVREAKASYSRDPVFFATCSHAESSPDHAVIALCKRGRKFCLLPPDSDISHWIDRLLNGELRWEDTEALPSDIKMNLP